LWRLQIDESSGKPLTAPEPVTTPAALAAHFSFSADGKRMLFSAYQPASHVYTAGFDAARGVVTEEPRQVTSGSRTWGFISLSHDGTKMVLASNYPEEDLFVGDTELKQLRPITENVATARNPSWSRDDREILAQLSRTGDQQQIYAVRADGGGMKVVTPQTLHSRPVSWLSPRVSPDATRLCGDTVQWQSSHLLSGDGRGAHRDPCVWF
jgi:Tol biopolymer transport system component